MFNSSWTDALFWVAALACAVAQLLIVRSVAVARPADGAALDARDTPQALVPPARRGPELAWAVLPALALAAVLVLTWRAMHPTAQPAAAPLVGVFS